MKGRSINGKVIVNDVTAIEVAVCGQQLSMAIIGFQDHQGKYLLMTEAQI
jgi:hypothetical protein